MLAVFILCLVWLVFNVFSLKYSFLLHSTCRIKTRDKVVFLSFDDGPAAATTPLILNTLKEKNVRALFFCIGREAELQPELVRRIAQEGHLIGNHTYRHNWQNTVKFPHAIAAEINQANLILQQISGQKIALFRPPFGVVTPALARAVKALHLRSVGWDIRSGDTRLGDPHKLIRRICGRLRPGSIILLHDNRPLTCRTLAELIDTIQQRGYRIEPWADGDQTAG